jgi:hypothetical protein
MNWEVFGQGLNETAQTLAGGLLKEYDRKIEEQYNIRREHRALSHAEEQADYDAAITKGNYQAQADINKVTEIEVMKERAKVETEVAQANEDYAHNIDNFLGDPEFLHGFRSNVLSGNPALMAQSLAQVKLATKLKGGEEGMTPEDETVFATMPPASQGKLSQILLQNKDIGIGFKTKLLDLDATHARIRYENAVTTLYTAQTDTGKVTPAQVEQWEKEANDIKRQLAGILTSKEWSDASSMLSRPDIGININDPKTMTRIATDPSFLQSVVPPEMRGIVGTIPQLAQIILDSKAAADKKQESADLFRGKIKAYGDQGKTVPPPKTEPTVEEPAGPQVKGKDMRALGGEPGMDFSGTMGQMKFKNMTSAWNLNGVAPEDVMVITDPNEVASVQDKLLQEVKSKKTPYILLDSDEGSKLYKVTLGEDGNSIRLILIKLPTKPKSEAKMYLRK